MRNIRFNNCLNQPTKLYNVPIGGLIVGGFSLLLFSIIYGVVTGVVVMTLGFFLGNWFGKNWYLGRIQSYIYWHLPIAKILIDKKLPESYQRKLM
ncbi:MAG: hypothetical protein HRU35_01010 [Rickettsiaceae bacterium]|nr:hypothetical protein [Rickettsiaceae bacterium]